MVGRKKLAFIVNPFAGMGGRVGLKGTDGVIQRALDLGAAPTAHKRAEQALKALLPCRDALLLLTGPGEMGEKLAERLGFEHRNLIAPSPAETTSEDTCSAARAAAEQGVELLLFAGGDGTARDILNGSGEKLPALGIPAGVKIQSAVFAISPAGAGEIARELVSKGRVSFSPAEVVDIDEDAYRCGVLRSHLFGWLTVPQARLLQGRKTGSPTSEEAIQGDIGRTIAAKMRTTPDTLWLLGPGTTTRAIRRILGFEGALLGVDAVKNGQLLESDLNEAHILELLDAHASTHIVVTPIGGQGYVFGRGNQQFSPEVLRRVGGENILVVATSKKIQLLMGKPLLLDTGDTDLDKELSGYRRICTGYNEEIVYRLMVA